LQLPFLGSWFDVSGTIVNILVALLFWCRIGAWLLNFNWFIKWQNKSVTGFDISCYCGEMKVAPFKNKH